MNSISQDCECVCMCVSFSEQESYMEGISQGNQQWEDQ